MADPRFFRRSGPLTLGHLAQLAGAELSGGANPSLEVEDVAPLDSAGPRNISFLDNIKYKEAFAKTKAGACIVSPEMAQHGPAGTMFLLSKTPYAAYARVAQAFYPGERVGDTKIHPSAVIGDGVQIGAGTCVDANAVIGENVAIGKSCHIGANVTVSHSLIGDHVRIYPGCCIGQDGFGYALGSGGHVKVPQLGRVIIEDHVEIGANTTIDRGSGPDTVIGAGTCIDNLVQIGHNVKVGRGCVLVAQSGVSGSTILEDYVIVGGQVGIAGHLRIGKGARIAAQTGVSRGVPPGAEIMGYPAVPLRQFMRQVAILGKMAKKEKSKD